jgi:hypothetical protein
MADFFFFTDVDLLNSQTFGQAYGPLSPSQSENYRVVSLLSSSSDANAYAICDGTILVQLDQDNPSYINIILKPHYQKELNYATVKYYLYKGIQLSSLINGIEIANRSNNQLTEFIWSSNDAFNLLNSTIDSPSSNALGIHLNAVSPSPNQFLDSDYLYKAFERLGDTFQLPTVKAGWTIGKFNSSEFGFEIIVSNLGIEPTFFSTRHFDHVINVPPLSSSVTDVFILNETKEKILNCIDPVAFFGLFYSTGIKGKLINSSPNFDLLAGDALYDTILNKFYTKDILYFDIRNEHNHNLNFYQNYPLGLNLTIDNGVLNNIQYADSFGWPIITINNSSFNSMNNDGILVLNLPMGDNESPLIYLKQGFYKDDFPSINNRFREPSFIGNFTSNISLKTLKHTTSNVVIPSYISLMYLKKFTSFPNSPTSPSPLTITGEHFIDNIFDLNILFDNLGNVKPLTNYSDNIKWRIVDNESFVDATSDYISFFIAKTGIAEDSSSIYLFAFDNGENLDKGSFDIPLPYFGTSSKIDFISDVLVDYLSEEFEIYNFEIPAIGGSIESIESNVVTAPSEVEKLTPNNSSIILVCINKITDITLLVNAMQQFSGDRQKWLCVRNYILKQDINNVPYYEGDLYVTGHDISGGTITVKSVNTNIKFSLSNG